jgi:HAD superfamily hydrolase (TIGR01509 family)
VKKLRAKALLIDLDGTIADSAEILEAAADAAFSAVGKEPSSDNVGRRLARFLQLNRPLEQIFEKHKVDESSRKEFLNVFLQTFYNLAANGTKLFPNVRNTLHELSRSFSLALITRRHVPRTHVAEELERLQIRGLFQAIVTPLDVARPTPSPDALLKAAEELHVPINSCVIVSDSGVDIRAGKRAGAKTVAVLSGLFDEQELREDDPDLIIENVRLLSEHLAPDDKSASANKEIEEKKVEYVD